MRQSVPLWVTVTCATVAVALTLVGDRVAVASTTASLDARVSTLEIGSRDSHNEILEEIHKIGGKVDNEAVMLQRLMDRDEEVRRRLGLER